MPWGLKRFHGSGQTHFVTFCCYHRRSSFTTPIPRQVFEAVLERVRRSFELCVYGYVVMPEHVHLLLSGPRQHTLADALKSLKLGVSRRLIAEPEHFWQKRYYDFNVRNERQFVEAMS
jgi:putative transposase